MASEPHDDNPEWTKEDFSLARPAILVHGAALAIQLVRTAGRPPLAPGEHKERVTIRLAPEILAHFREGGRGWQTRLEDVLRGAIGKDKALKRG